MKTMPFLLVAALAIAPPSPLEAQDARAEVEAIVDDFVRGWRDGDAETLNRVFALDAGFVQWVSGQGDEQQASAMTFRDIVARDKTHPNYGLPHYEILSLDVVENRMAFAKVAIPDGETMNYDYLVMFRVADSWKIMSNTFVVVPR